MKPQICILIVCFCRLAFPVSAGDISLWRVLGVETSVITDVTTDGYLVWINESEGQIDRIQVATSLDPTNWIHFTSVLVTGSFVSYRVLTPESPDYLVIDLSEGPSATNYPVTWLAAAPYGGWPEEYRSSKIVCRRIPPGTFMMGAPTNELGRDSDERQHLVTIYQTYYIGVFEVTQKQWERVMGTWPSYFTNSTYRDTRPVEQVSYYDIRECAVNKGDPAVYWPSNNVVNANSFMGKLREKTGLMTLDLPTETQWEYACRAGTATALNSGQNLTNRIRDEAMNLVGRYIDNHPGGYSWDEGVNTGGGTAKVGSYQANAWGLYDMHGNVSEWCLDGYGAYPGTVTNQNWEVLGTNRIIRGGGWNSEARTCRSANRNFYLNGPSHRSPSGGFRIVITFQ
ncbi:MAG TPA: formylglycine-generating enzyme family protein [Kiritimatiellia bacterium]|nr:formylglycine-generating enzyme family protein [Kiritimatiellia bacterium]HMO98217.1 formylglycine-generating enzyme family protein [Kiritimatiellia bacterium]HMP97667.1 formylglycine-generating enzyme family protein [Kiritimatiellia bacterium]